jgi:hypothetical protein
VHDQLGGAANSLEISLPNLETAANRTQQIFTDACTEVNTSLASTLNGFTKDEGLDILAFGSMARDEMAPGSDFDYLVIANEIVPNPRVYQAFRSAALSALTAIGATGPGASGLFGVMVAAPDMVNQIGLEEDTNKSLSRRILVLQESVCLNKHNRYENLVDSIISRYLDDYVGKDEPRVPRFLFNDVVRFWRTIAVDYQAKRWHEMEGTKWGLRYIKLRSSRKWTFAGSIMSLFMPVIAQADTTCTFLISQFEMPPLARLAQLHAYIDPAAETAGELRKILLIADQFQGWHADKDWRTVINPVNDPTAPKLPAQFDLARQRTHDLQEALERLFFSVEPLNDSGCSLASLTRKYLTF